MEDKKDTMITIDLETTIKNDIGKGNRPSPFSPKNRIVASGRSVQSEVTSRYNSNYYTSSSNNVAKNLGEHVSRIVGHNLKFDLHYLRKNGLEDLHTINVWDTQIAEYILSGQQDKFPKLDDVAPKYGGTHKIDKVKELWDAGVETEDIDQDLLMEYLEGDVKNTELVALAQMQECMDRGILPFVETQMDAVLAVEEMEYNGMHVDTKKLAELRKSLTLKLTDLSNDIIDAFYKAHHKDLHKHPELINISSPRVLSHLLFGGVLKYKEKEKVGVYKNGNDKFKQIEHEIQINALYSDKTEWHTKTGISTSDSVLEELAKKDTLGIAKKLQAFRGASKELSTYIIGLGDLIYPDGKLHGSLHQTSTSTGRLSSAQPNLQNMPSGEDSEIKKIFTSRWGKKGVIIEADYSQLEVICLAFLSGDKQLQEDILLGKDMHKETGKLVFGTGMSKDERRIVKTINFGLIYGGKAGTLSKQANVSKELAQQCLDAFFTRYPQVKQWQEDTFKQVCLNRTFEGGVSNKGFPAGVSHYESITGRRYTFKEYDKPDWMTWEKANVLFSPQETRNYPVQGFATADIVPMMVGILFKVLKNDERTKYHCLMINTVHDSIIFDCDLGDLHYSMRLIKETLEDAPKYIKEKLGIDFNLPLKAEVSYGINWKEQKEVDFS